MNNMSLGGSRKNVSIAETARPGISPWTTFAKYIALIALCIVVAGPVLTAILGSIRTSGEFLAEPFGFPRHEILWEH
jgi:ABC-type glycerol-3-phosphate transport system permease component